MRGLLPRSCHTPHVYRPVRDTHVYTQAPAPFICFCVWSSNMTPRGVVHQRLEQRDCASYFLYHLWHLSRFILISFHIGLLDIPNSHMLFTHPKTVTHSQVFAKYTS